MAGLVTAIKCGITFQTVDEFRAAFVARGELCFVPYPDEVAPGSTLDIDVDVESVFLELRGEVTGSDFDESGNIGLAVRLDDASREVVAQFDLNMREGQAPIPLFATTRLGASVLPSIPSSSPSAVAAAHVPTPYGGPEEKLQPGELVAGRFRIERHIATGGMGDVYRAEHVHLKRPVALKLLRPELSADHEMWGRFEREAQLVSQLENPHVVRVFDFGRTDQGQLFLAMEFVEGETLDKRVEQGPLPPALAVEVLTQVLDGLGEAHNLGVVHRDLKPPNIILGKRREGGERAKILDFGIARLSDKAQSPEKAKLTQVGVVVGTPAYLAPEQALADELDHRTDIYAMGCVAYELLTGRPPFVETDLRKVISAHLTSAPPALPSVRPELAAFPVLCAAVIRALAKEKENRFQTVTEFAAALRKGLSDSAAAPTVTPVPPVPQASAPWPPPAPEWGDVPAPVAPPAEWDAPPSIAPSIAPVTSSSVARPPTPAPRAVTPPPSASPPVAVPRPAGLPAADDFFAATGAAPIRAPAEVGAALPGAAKLAAAPGEPTTGVSVRVELLGPAPKSDVATTCTSLVTDVMARAGAFLAGRDEEGLVFGFVAPEGNAAPRAAQALVSAREQLAVLAGELKVAATLRALMMPTRFPAGAETINAGRVLLARARANTAWVDQRLAAFVGRVCEVLVTDQKGLLSLGGRRPRKRVAADLLGRKTVVDALERRLDSLQQGVVASLLITGPAGAGHSSLANLLATVARKRGALTVLSSGLDEPYGALIEMLCSALGVEVHERARKLRAALEPLPIVDGAKTAAMVLAGVAPSPAGFTPGQAGHALRVVLRAVGVGKSLVVICDGLHVVDKLSREAFFAMAERPASRELLVGFGTPESVDPSKNLPVVPLPPLSNVELQRLLTVTLGGLPGPNLAGAVMEASGGTPAGALDALTWFDEQGYLGPDSTGAIELLEPSVSAPKAAVAFPHWLGAVARQTLVAAALLGERFDAAQVRELVPQCDLAGLQVLGLVVPSEKRLRLRSLPLRRALLAVVTPETVALRRRFAEWLIARGKTDPASVEPTQLARVLTEVRDGVRAAPVWKHALEQAMQRRDWRAVKTAWAGIAHALAFVPQPETQARMRVDALSRAAAHALLLDEPVEARAYLNEAATLAGALPAPSPDYLLVEARALRLEGRRVKGLEVLQQAEAAAQGGPMWPLVLAEQGEAREVEGDLPGAFRAFEQARQKAHEAKDFATWHGEVALGARLEARLATIFFAQKDASRAKAMLDSSLVAWRKAAWPWAEARVLSTLGTVYAFMQQFNEAASAYEAAGVTAARSGDLQFQARAMIQQARAIRRVQGVSAAMRSVAQDARKLSLALGWEQGRLDATALIEGK